MIILFEPSEKLDFKMEYDQWPSDRKINDKYGQEKKY